jgi:hypothetical protein
MVLAASIAVAIAGTPFGGDDTGTIPSDAPKGPITKCENGVAKAVAKLVGGLGKCHAARAIGTLPDDAAEDTCEGAALAKFNTTKTAACGACTNITATGSAVEALTDANNDQVYCTATGTPFGGDDTGNIPSDAPTGPVTKCENNVGKSVGKLVSALLKCHAGRTSGKFTSDAAEDTCETTALTKFGATKTTGCDKCTNLAALGSTVASRVDGTNSLIYCDELTCPWAGPAVFDPTVFAACSSATCSGAHCVPAAIVPPGEQSLLAVCTDGLCAPDAVIAAGGEFVPKSCTSIAGAEGRCLSTCLPSVAEAVGLPQSGECDAGERCMPCYDPITSNPDAPTGACSVACDRPSQAPVHLTCPWNGPPVFDPNGFAACSPACSGAHCVPAGIVPSAEQSLLAACSPDGFCVPDPIIAAGGNYIPPSCVAFAGTTAEGRCLSDCLPGVAAQPLLELSSCAVGSKCAPCTDPYTGASTGSCSTSSCDQPTQPAFTFPGCCPVNATLTGTCVPSTQVSAAQQSSLAQDECPSGSAGYLCVPHEYLPGGTPSTCTATLPIPGPGACVSRCTDLGTLSFLPQADCPDNDVCVPCSLAPGTPGCS